MSRPPLVPPSPSARHAKARSAVSNGGLPGGVRAGSPEGRRFVDVTRDLAAELSGELTAAEVLQVRTIAGLIVRAEQLQAMVLRGEAVSDEQLVRVSNSAARLLGSLKRGRAPARTRRRAAIGGAPHPLAKVAE